MNRTLLTCLALLTVACHRFDLDDLDDPAAGASTTAPNSVATAEPQTSPPQSPPVQEPTPPAQSETEPPTPEPVVSFKSTINQVPFLNGQALLARDPVTGDLGICYLSAIPGAAAHVPDGRAGVGVVAVTGKSQAHWRSAVLDRLAAGESPKAIVADLTKDEFSNRTRQIGIVGFDGQAAAFTGAANLKLSASKAGNDIAIVIDQAQDQAVIEDIEKAFHESVGLPLPERLLAALAASPQVDGTNRPYLSGCLLVYREKGGPDGKTDRFVDIRVDFDLDVIEKLKTIYETTVTVFTGPRLLKLHKMLDDSSNPLYKANRDWIKRLRTPHEIGVLRRD